MAVMSDQPAPRRRFQFSLRTLMIGVTLFAINAGIWSMFGSPLYFYWVQAFDGREGWEMGGSPESGALLLCELLIAGILILNKRYPRP